MFSLFFSSHFPFSQFESWQKTNFIPGVQALIRKDNLHRSITAMQRKHGQENFDFWPESFNLPEEWAAFSASAAQKDTAWILKPPASSCGRRIRAAASFEGLVRRFYAFLFFIFPFNDLFSSRVCLLATIGFRRIVLWRSDIWRRPCWRATSLPFVCMWW